MKHLLRPMLVPLLVPVLAAVLPALALADDVATPPKRLTEPPEDTNYPAAARRRNEEGIAVVHVCIAADGAVTTSLLTSSGHPLLDDAAQDQFRLVRWKAATLNGVPVERCWDYTARYCLQGGVVCSPFGERGRSIASPQH